MMCTAVLSERIACLCNFSTSCGESLDVPLKASLLTFVCVKVTKMGLCLLMCG